MYNVDFARYYDDHADYVTLRDTSSDFYKQYVQEVDFWKNRYLCQVMGNLCPASIVEIGCATGILLARFPAPSAKLRVGIDISQSNIDRAKSQFPELQFYAGDAGALWKASTVRQSFDIGILSDILEHVDDDVGLLSLMAGHADNVLLNLPLEKCQENEGREYGVSDRHGHLRSYDLADARALVTQAGLIEVSSVVRHYVLEPVFRKYLATKLFGGLTGEALLNGMAKYLQEINEIEVNPAFYKSNYFALLRKDG